ncbi:MAG: hypothetical protein CMM86_10585 [Rhodovulum sp.]|nr:hypothetical protein [Rhodovulum sp.]|tara:strand:- start:511 stop:1905 length:1395 start_codon:yes stop_codon:yes gene_type:complete
MSQTTQTTKVLSEYAISTRYEHYPTEVTNRAKRVIIDTVGCMFGGAPTALGRSMLETMTASGETGTSTVVGSNARFGAATAALVNGTNANALDFDETLEGIGHPSASVIPAALAVGELHRISGKAFLTGILTGFDVGNRIGKAIQPSYERLQQVWNVGTWQTLGAAAAAARVLKLDLLQTQHAYGIAGATAPLPNTQKWGWDLAERPIHWVKEPTGWASWTGATAALLAARGFVGNRFILDGPKGFWIMAGSDRCDFDAMVTGLGEDFAVMDLSLKPYPCCRWQHAALDCVEAIISTNDLGAIDIKSVDIYSFDWVEAFEVYGPKDMVDAEFSLPYSVTMLAHRIPRGADWFTPQTLRNPEFVDYSQRVRVHADQEMNRIFHTQGDVCARVKITTKTGNEFVETSTCPSGSPAKFLDDNVIFDKFLSLAEPVLGHRAGQLLDRLLVLEEVEDLAQLAALMRPGQ